jgi:hypothetical protein
MRRFLFLVPVLMFSVTAGANSPPPSQMPFLFPHTDFPPPVTSNPITLNPIPLQPNAYPPVGFDSNAILRITSTTFSPTARLRLPRALVQSLLTPAQAQGDAWSTSPARTVMAGLAISAAVTAAGLTIARRKNTDSRRTALLAITAMLAFAAVQASANMRVPFPPPPRIRLTPFPTDGSMPVMVELSDDYLVEMQFPSAPVAP